MIDREYLMRSLMFVPAHNDKLLESSIKRDADVLLLDIEDSVPPIDKQLARDNIKKFASKYGNSKVIFPRVNDRESGELLKDAYQLTIDGIEGFVFPKATKGEDIYFFGKLLETIEYEKGIPIGTFKIIPLIETAGSVINIQEICKACTRVIAVAFGCEDYVTDMQGKHNQDYSSIFTARNLIAIGARASGVTPIDTVHIKVHDLEDLERNLQISRELGYEGMLVLNPKELPLVNKYYSPTVEEKDWANEMISLSKQAEKEGKGVAVKDGKFIGPPMKKMAEKILKKHSIIIEKINRNLLDRFEFRKATYDDYDIYYKIKCDKDAVGFSGFALPPDYKKFKKVFENILISSDQYLYLLEDKDKNNQISATFHFKENDKETVEGLGYNVFPEYRGMKLGWVMMNKINEMCKKMGYKYRLSIVSEKNIASIHNLENSGAYPTGEIEERKLPGFNRTDKYLYYLKEL